jgi:hypothetical protein
MAYTPEKIEEVFEYICQEIEKGRSLRSVLRESDMPSSRTFSKWISEDEVKVKQYAYATEQRAEMIFEDILTIADDNSNDEVLNEDGVPIVNNDVINRARLKIDARKWILAKMVPKKYSEKTQTELIVSNIPVLTNDPLADTNERDNSTQENIGT